MRVALSLMLALVVLLPLSSTPVRAEMSGGLTIGDVAPDGAVTPLGGSAEVALSAAQGGKVMVFVMFSTSCPHCQQETKALNQIFATLDPAKVSILATSLGEPAEKVLRFRERFAVKYPLALDPQRKLQRPFNIQGVPTYFILDAQRKVRAQGHAESAEKMMQQIQAALGQ